MLKEVDVACLDIIANLNTNPSMVSIPVRWIPGSWILAELGNGVPAFPDFSAFSVLARDQLLIRDYGCRATGDWPPMPYGDWEPTGGRPARYLY